jgi:hypothetical protein
MKIIRSGMQREWWVGRKIVCQQCNCEFQLEEGDKVTVTGDRDHECSINATVNCPTCNREASVHYLPIIR